MDLASTTFREIGTPASRRLAMASSGRQHSLDIPASCPPDFGVQLRTSSRGGEALPESGLVQGTSGNVSERNAALVVLKPGGVTHKALTPESLGVVNLSGEVIEGELRPSVDTSAHLCIYSCGERAARSPGMQAWARSGTRRTLVPRLPLAGSGAI